MLALAADPEAQPDHLLFLGRERLEDAGRLVANIGLDDGIDRGADPAIFDQIAQRGFSIPANRGFERHRVT